MTEVVLRETIESDLSTIFRIRRSPEVARQQFPILAIDSQEKWIARIKGDNKLGDFTLRQSSILYSDLVIGHIVHSHYEVDSVKYVKLGWNLHPDYWGRRIMAQALCRQFKLLVDRWQIAHAFADCFSRNERCIRLMTRLGFVRQDTPLYERLLTAYKAKCWKWTFRFGLDLHQWDADMHLYSVTQWRAGDSGHA